MAKKKSKAAPPDLPQTEAELTTAEAVPENAPENAIEAAPAAEIASHETPAADEAAVPMNAGSAAEDDEAGGLDESVEDVAAEEEENEISGEAQPPARLERLQKILAQAGVASRRKAEELIREGRVQVNGQIVTTLGTKADAGRDHIRVDGKLLHGAERHRYFVLNKPKGYVTTVSDPQGRPTVMQFFHKTRERLYPVGRLDYMSEGLLLVTNDGELANQLTRAASGVEKTYLVKVSGQPTEAELELLRGGVGIERGQPGSKRVVTGPARIRQVRVADNPWFEVVLTEGRNRELRKMFEQTGHFVEKIRRVGYGPLVLDQEPGKFRELEPEELEALRRAAEGKPPMAKIRRGRRERGMDTGYLPTVSPRPRAWQRQTKTTGGRSDGEQRVGQGGFGAKRSFAAGRAGRPGARPGQTGGDRPAWKKESRQGQGKSLRGRRPPGGFAGAKLFGGRSYGKQTGAKQGFSGEDLSGRTFSGKPAKPDWKKQAGSRPPFKRAASVPRGEGAARTRPERGSSAGGRGRPGFRGKPGGFRDTSPRPGGKRPGGSRYGGARQERPRPGGSRPGGPRTGGKLSGPKRTGGKRPGKRRHG